MQLNLQIIEKALSYAYDKAVNGVEVKGHRVLDSAYDLAESYTNKDRSVRQNATSLINWQCSKSAISGFTTNLGGVALIPVGLPANITSVLFIQIRMIAAIALMCGKDLKDDKTQTLVYACLTGNAVKDVFKNVGVKVGTKITEKLIKEKVTRETLVKINQAVHFKLLTKFGEKGVINLGKMVPFVGGIIGGSIDATYTKLIGKVAKSVFIDGKVM